MSFLSSLLAWANAPFTVALGVAVLFALLQMTGLLGLLAGGGDGHDGTDHDLDHDLDADHDLHHDGDTDHDHDADDGSAAHGGDIGHQLLVGLGVGRAPLSILWQTYAASFAFAGLAANAIYLGHAGALPLHTLAWTLPGALVFGYAVTSVLGHAVGRMVSDPTQEATSRQQLVGHTGIVISSKVNDAFGEVRVRDKTGHVLRIICRTREAEAMIAEGREIVIVDYDALGDHLIVAPLDDDDGAPSRARTPAP